jgi:hypothetical protein
MGIEQIQMTAPPIPAPTGYQVEGWGPQVSFYDGSEVPWGFWADEMDTVWNTHSTLPVKRDKYFPNDTNLVSSVGIQDSAIANNYLNNWGLDIGPNTGGVMHYRPEWMQGRLSGDEDDRPSLAITDAGWQDMQVPPKLLDYSGSVPGQGTYSSIEQLPYQATGMHEYGGHLIDYDAGDTSTNVYGDIEQMSNIMDSYRHAPAPHTDWTQENLYNRWMGDPRTSHLNVEDPTDRIHHAGRNNPREGFGQYISTALTDPGYQNIWGTIPEPEGFMSEEGYNEAKKYTKYRQRPEEIFARASANSLRPHVGGQGEFTSITPNLDRIYANSLATFLNSR